MTTAMKDQLFNAEKTAWLAARFAAGPGFDRARFEGDVASRLADLELKDRIDWIATCLARQLPDDFAAAADMIEAALPPELDPTARDDDFGDFIIAPLGAFVARHGQGDAARALDLIHALTRRFSMEWAIRPFLERHPEQTIDRLDDWVTDRNYHVRRLVSEGTRPRLPWAPRLNLPLDRRLGWLEVLFADRTRYVTRSVANHLNDIAKDDAGAVVDALTTWGQGRRQTPSESAWITRHALRSLIKAGDRAALDLLGYPADPPVRVALDIRTPRTVIGDALVFAVELTAERATALLVDYALRLPGAKGPRPAKVFKLRTFRLRAGERITLTKRHRLKGDATTYRLYPGPAQLTVQINGAQKVAAGFSLVAGD